MDDALRRAQSLVGTSPGRPELDFYPTPPAGTEALLSCETFAGTIWEPACGDGSMSDVLKATGHLVYSSDVADYGYGADLIDFLTVEPEKLVDHVITNPPFRWAQAFVEKALEMTSGKVAILAKLQFLETAGRKSFFQSTPLARVHVFSKRLSLYRDGKKGEYSSGMIAFAWYIWEHGYKGEPVLRWI